MALGKIKADTLEHSTAGSLDTQYVVNGSAKAWVNFNSSPNPPSIQGSFNVSSLTDAATEIAFNLTSAMSDAFYAPVGSGGGPTITNPANRSLAMNCISTTQVDTELYTTSNAQTLGYCHGSVSGELA